MQFLLSLIDDTGDLATPDETAVVGDPNPESRMLDAFNDRLVAEGYWVFSGGLAAPGTATVIDNRGGDALFTDGPFVESKEHLGGLWIIEVELSGIRHAVAPPTSWVASIRRLENPHSLSVPGMLRERSTRPCSRVALIE